MLLLEQLAQTTETRPGMKNTFPVEGGGVGRANSNYNSLTGTINQPKETL